MTYTDEEGMMTAEAFESEVDLFAQGVKQHASTMPAAEFATDPLWAEAQWSATTFQWHPASEAPPLMGLVFENEEAGLEIFSASRRHDESRGPVRGTPHLDH